MWCFSLCVCVYIVVLDLPPQKTNSPLPPPPPPRICIHTNTVAILVRRPISPPPSSLSSQPPHTPIHTHIHTYIPLPPVPTPNVAAASSSIRWTLARRKPDPDAARSHLVQWIALSAHVFPTGRSRPSGQLVSTGGGGVVWIAGVGGVEMLPACGGVVVVVLGGGGGGGGG